jgi:predicted transcriptional regulator
MAKENHLKLKTRRNLYNFVLKHPGNHLRGISKTLKIHKNTVAYHLNYLVGHGLVIERSENGYKRYYATRLEGEKFDTVAKVLTEKIPYDTISKIYRIFACMNPGIRDREIIGLLKQNSCRKIVKVLLLKPNSSQIELCNFLNKHHSTVSFYLKKLAEKDIIQSSKKQGKIRYKIKDEDYILNLLGVYFGIRELFNIEGNPIGKYDYFMLDSIIEGFSDVFPCPFCAGGSNF